MDSEPVVQPLWCFVWSKGCCAGKKLKHNEAFVPDVEWLYERIHGTGVDRRRPLTEEQMRRFVRCRIHAFGPVADAYHKKHAIKAMYHLEYMLALMDRWKDQTPEAREKRRQEKREQRKLERADHEPAPAVTKTKKYGEMAPVVKKSKKPAGDEKKNKKGKGR